MALPHTSASMSGIVLMLSSSIGHGFAAATAGARALGSAGPRFALGSIIVEFPTGTENDASPCVVESMVTPNTGGGATLGGSLGGDCSVGGGSATVFEGDFALGGGGGG